jgi:hypothetical protein
VTRCRLAEFPKSRACFIDDGSGKQVPARRATLQDVGLTSLWLGNLGVFCETDTEIVETTSFGRSPDPSESR